MRDPGRYSGSLVDGGSRADETAQLHHALGCDDAVLDILSGALAHGARCDWGGLNWGGGVRLGFDMSGIRGRLVAGVRFGLGDFLLSLVPSGRVGFLAQVFCPFHIEVFGLPDLV